jgi:endo-1,4-beta-xylanase
LPNVYALVTQTESDKQGGPHRSLELGESREEVETISIDSNLGLLLVHFELAETDGSRAVLTAHQSLGDTSMKISMRALLSAALLAAMPLAAMAQTEPVIVEAESGTLGTSVTTGTLEGATYVTAAVNITTGPTGASDPRVSSYQITFPAAGDYELYARMRVGQGGGDDDSWYFGNGFGVTNDWPLYNTSGGGFTDPAATVLPDGPAGTQVFKWVRLTALPNRGGGLGPNAWTVPAGALTQTFYWSTREDGMFMDKFAFGRAGSCYTVANLDTGSAATGTCPPPPPPPPPPYEHSGPPMATGKDKFVGSAWSPGEASLQFDRYFNKVTPENAGKWASIERERDVMNWTDLDTAYNLAKSNGWPFHYHVLVWGNQQPTWIETLPPAEQLEEIREFWTAVATRYPGIDFMEVVNEPLHDPPFGTGNGNYGDALGGRGAAGTPEEWTWILNAFRMAREIFPNAKLMLNDYSITNDGNATTRYLGIINLLKAEGLIDIIGDQAHGFSTTEAAPMPNHRANLDRLAATGLPIHITELDIPGTEDEVQLANYKRIFPVFWEHPAVEGVTLWGYHQNTHWRRTSGDWLMWGGASAGAQRPALTWLVSYVSNNEPVISAQTLSVNENAANGTSVGTVTATDADAGQTLSGWQIDGGSGVPVFAIDSATGALTVVDGTALDFETTTSYSLNVSVYDGYRRGSGTVTINVNNLNDNTPAITSGQTFAVDGGTRNVLGAAQATDADDTNQPGFTTFQGWQVVGGTGANLFAIGPSNGVIRASRPLSIDWRKTSYTLVLKTSDGANTSPQQSVTITIPNRVKTCLYGLDITAPKQLTRVTLLLGGTLGTCRAP